ncbi:MAG: hypothetical protein ABF505_14275, partial [Schleiferilactobacillus harbinensis]|uniref:hypothetical protein n=1 Tax=Schleiferilactobacillus harbinensis TaxID=304207 RepID=UPI0039EC2E4D
VYHNPPLATTIPHKIRLFFQFRNILPFIRVNMRTYGRFPNDDGFFSLHVLRRFEAMVWEKTMTF